ncbi:MAG TPA: PrsW family glutamic-type intramembrane protease, partial [Gemmatales bacterium]|nr:PrsW family glutamic-type intramembrane protease [Gemmatales bacterium]
ITFVQSLISYTFGVGLCEEIIKALPIFFVFLGRSRLRWHECCALGLASGIGFGIAESIHYSATMYNGLTDSSMYMVRFISCVTLHAVWCAASALFLHRYQRLSHGNLTVLTAFYRMFILISIPMVLHGLYDTFLSKGMESLALTIAVFSFGWLVVMIETAREKEGDRLIQVRNVISEMTPLHAQAELKVNPPVEGPPHAVSPSPL